MSNDANQPNAGNKDAKKIWERQDGLLGLVLGAGVARITTTLLHAMRDRKARYGLATMCIGAGQGIATIFENCQL